MIGAQRAMTTPKLFLAATKRKTIHFLEPKHILNKIPFFTSRKELMPPISSYRNSHDIFCWANKRLNLKPKNKQTHLKHPQITRVEIKNK